MIFFPKNQIRDHKYRWSARNYFLRKKQACKKMEQERSSSDIWIGIRPQIKAAYQIIFE